MIPNLTTEQRRVARTQQTMRKLHISESRRLRGLGANQRAALVELFGGAQ